MGSCRDLYEESFGTILGYIRVGLPCIFVARSPTLCYMKTGLTYSRCSAFPFYVLPPDEWKRPPWHTQPWHPSLARCLCPPDAILAARLTSASGENCCQTGANSPSKPTLSPQGILYPMTNWSGVKRDSPSHPEVTSILPYSSYSTAPSGIRLQLVSSGDHSLA